MTTTGRIFSILAWAASTAAHAQFNFSQVQYWAGAGADSSVLVIDFQDGTGSSAFAWGYLHDGAVSGQELVSAIAEADPALAAATTGGFLGDVTYGAYAGLSGSPDYWSTWNSDGQGGWSSNMGLSEMVGHGELFGCSYTDFDPAIEPGPAVPAAVPTGIRELRAASVHVWPQPATDVLHVQSSAAGQHAAVLYNMAGSAVARSAANGATIDVRLLPAGMYVLQFGLAKRLVAVH